MIYVDRAKIKEPHILCTDGIGGRSETQRNITYAQNRQWNRIRYKAYSDNSVKKALIELFKGKCAYCESITTHNYLGDVEHFRPKGKIEEASPEQTPGYYWLAADWDNLFLSCRNCNQQAYHLIHGEANEQKLGKMNQFPLGNNYAHVQTHVGHPIPINQEEDHRLLLNPCKENPELHLEYDEVEAIIKPKKTENTLSSKGLKSIEVYVLQRMALVQRREKTLIAIHAQISRIIATTEMLEEIKDIQALNERRIKLEEALKQEIRILKDFTLQSAEYAGMARQIINSFLAKHLNIAN